MAVVASCAGVPLLSAQLSPGSRWRRRGAVCYLGCARRLDSMGGRLRPSSALGVQAEHDDGTAWRPGPGRLIARSAHCRELAISTQPEIWSLTCVDGLERVTGIEPALSAWESDRSGSLTALAWAA